MDGMDGSAETMLSSAPLLPAQSVPSPKYEIPKTPAATRGSPSRDQLSQEHYKKAYEYEKQNRLKEALAEYGQAIAFNPKWPEPYYRCGLILVKNKDYNTALQKLHDAVKLDPTNADAHYQIGKIYIDRNIKDDAEKYLKLAVKNNPKLTAAKNLLANLYEKVSSATQKSCPKCASMQSNRAKFCGNCGYTFPI
jgi:tetratricopeptide (TPR) repeat protein